MIMVADTSMPSRLNLLRDASRHIRDRPLRKYEVPGIDVSIGAQLNIWLGAFGRRVMCVVGVDDES